MEDRHDWERERMRNRGSESSREDWGRGREGDRERESQFTGGEERNRMWEREGRYGRGVRDPYYSGSENAWNQGTSNQGSWNQGRGYDNEGRREFEGRWNEERGYGGERGYEGSRGYEAQRAYEGSRGGYEGTRGRYEGSREDYGPGALTRQFRGGTEYFGAGQRGYGATWGGVGGSWSYGGGPGAYSGGLGTYGSQGRFSGRGPKGYQRSDERIREDVCERLTQHPEIDAVEIEIQVKNGEVTLIGVVDNREEKRMAEDVAECVSGVKDVHNQLRAQQNQQVTVGQGGQSGHGNKQEAGGGSASRTR